jgi:hypothetical protein
MAALSWVMGILVFWPADSEPWLIAKAVIAGVLAVVMCIKATRFSLWQRDEYWRSRGKDPKHPERLGKAEGQ